MTYTMSEAEQALANYTEAYKRLYRRAPRDLHMLDAEWVLVNGARMRAQELAFLTDQLHQEYGRGLSQKRGMILRLLDWFKQ